MNASPEALERLEELRDRFAMAALHLVWTLGRDNNADLHADWRYLAKEENWAENARDAYAVADAMLQARAALSQRPAEENEK